MCQRLGFLGLLELSKFFRAVFFRRENGPHYRSEKYDGARIECKANRIRHLACRGDVTDLKPIGEHPWQCRSHDSTHTDKKTLHREAHGALLIGQHIAHECPKWLHRNINGRIHDPQHARGDPERRRIWHDQQGQRRQNSAPQKIRATTPELRPRAIAVVADQGLNYETCYRCGNPKYGNIIYVRA